MPTSMVPHDPSATATAAVRWLDVAMDVDLTAALEQLSPTPRMSVTQVEPLEAPQPRMEPDDMPSPASRPHLPPPEFPPLELSLQELEFTERTTALSGPVEQLQPPRYLDVSRDDVNSSQQHCATATPASLSLPALEDDDSLTPVPAELKLAVLHERPIAAVNPGSTRSHAPPRMSLAPRSEFGSLDLDPTVSGQPETLGCASCSDKADTVMSVSIDNGIAQRRASNRSMMMMSSLGRNLRRASGHFKTVLVGDDEEVHDKWDNYDDDVEEEIEAVKRGLSMVMRSKSRSAGAHVSRSGHSKVMPASASSDATKSMEGGLSMESHSPLEDVLDEKRASRTLIWYYGQTCLFSMVVTAVCIPLVQLMSIVSWHEEVSVNATSSSSVDDQANQTQTGDFQQFRPNHVALQGMLLLQIVMPLCIYAVLLYACIQRSFSIPWPMLALVAFTVVWSTLVCGMFYKFNIAFWFFYGDLFLIVAAYVPCMCMVGWYVEVDPNATTKHRLMDVAVTAMLETSVAAATLVYCFFIMPLFFTLTNAWLQMLWLCVIHPLYFEATTGFVVRKVLQRNRQLGRNHIVYLLSIVHSMVHVVVLATSLQASIEPVRILALTVLLYNLAKLTWRSTVIQRDLFVERLFHGWSFNYSSEDLAELSRMVSVGIITEIILENASVFIAPFMMFRMYKEPLFMAVVPNSFFDNGGTYPVSTLITLIALLFSFTATFDLIFVFLNYHVVQHLPLINTWRRIKRSQGWYLMFLIYAFAAMGVMFLFLTMMILPRAAYCKTDNYCDCSTLTYQTICEGQYISTLVDYLVAP